MTEVMRSSFFCSISAWICLVSSWNFTSPAHEAGQCAFLPHWKHQSPPQEQATETGLLLLAMAPDVETLKIFTHLLEGHHLNSELDSMTLSIFCDRNLSYQVGTKAIIVALSTQTSHLCPGHCRSVFPKLICVFRWTSQHWLQKVCWQCFRAVKGVKSSLSVGKQNLFN